MSSSVTPRQKVTSPLVTGSPDSVSFTVAVKVTSCPTTDVPAGDALRAVVVPIVLTLWLKESSLPWKLVSPPYSAVISWVPAGSVLVKTLATPDPSSVPVMTPTVPSVKVTVPVGVIGANSPSPAASTVAVKVRVWPKSDGLAEDSRDVSLSALFTVWVTVSEVLPSKLLSPPYSAQTSCSPGRSVFVTTVTTEPVSGRSSSINTAVAVSSAVA